MTGSAAAIAGSFDRLRRKHDLQRIELMPARERQERLVGRRAISEIGLEHPLDGPWRVGRLHVTEELAAERRIRTEAAADMDMIALDRIGILADLDLAGDQPDVADVVLRAGMMASGEMDVDRRLQCDARL